MTTGRGGILESGAPNFINRANSKKLSDERDTNSLKTELYWGGEEGRRRRGGVVGEGEGGGEDCFAFSLKNAAVNS